MVEKKRKSEQKGISETQRQYYRVLEKREINRSDFNNALVQELINVGHVSLTRIEPNLYLRITKPGTGFWVYQYKIHNKPRRMTLGKYGKRPDKMPLADARDALGKARAMVNRGKDPLAEKKRDQRDQFKIVDHLAIDWLESLKTRVKHYQIPSRIYNQEIEPVIGDIAINDITGLDIRKVLEFTRNRKKEQRRTIVNDTLTYLKQLFAHGITLGVTHSNPANAFNSKHAGGSESERERNLTLDEIRVVFQVFRSCQSHFVRENYLAVALLICLGVRKTELTAARWDEIDLKNQLWCLPKERAKNKCAIDIPLPDQVTDWFEELKYRAGKSEYVFPARRVSRRREYISDDTLNHALCNLFGKKTGKLQSSTGNVLGQAGIAYFVIHDLRRSTRTLMENNKVREVVAEKCINHVKKKGVRTYNRALYFDERVEAHQQLADQVAPLVNL